MTYLYLVLALLAVLVVIFVVKRGGGDKSPPQRTMTPIAPPAPAPLPAKVPAPANSATPPSPSPQPRSIVRNAHVQIDAMLRDFEWTHSADLSAGETAVIVDVLRRLPRPPSALHKLVSPEFLANANTTELADMVIAEPEIAAKVLVVVNSPFYGLQSPLASIGQAVTFLGMNTVRGICLQYMLDESFQSKDPEVRQTYERLWSASAFASELCHRLSKALALPDAGALVTQVVLSFLGHVASHSLLSKEMLLPMMGKGMLERSRVEQRELGLCAAEIGSLLMREWALPEPIVQSVRDIDYTLVTPYDAAQSERLVRAAFCYVCARLGERLAYGQLQDLGSVDLTQDTSLEFFHLQSYLQQTVLARMNDALHAPELIAAIHNMAIAAQVRK